MAGESPASTARRTRKVRVADDGRTGTAYSPPPMRQRPLAFKFLAALLAAAIAGGGVALASGANSRAAGRPHAPKRANVVFILTDDLSWNLINSRFMPHVVALEKRGETFSHYFVSDSLCCPSRSSIFTGLFPHDTKVVANVGKNGGFQKFQSERLYRRTFAVAIRSRGYRTAMMGKYLNGYGNPTMNPSTAPVPPGWSDWHVASNGYVEFNYTLNENGAFNRYGGPTGGCGVTGKPDNYGVDVLSARARSFIAASKGKPFALEVATFAPHSPYIPAPRNACDFPGLTEPRDPSFNAANINPPAWLAHKDRKVLTAEQIARIDHSYRMRAQAVESVDKLLADVEATLAREHLTDSTYIVFSSDNGYHLGQHRLSRGKQTAFDTDIRVPLIVAGPGVPKGRAMPQVVQNVDLYPTFVQLAGGSPGNHIDGHSLLPLLHPAKTVPSWRTVALVEHHHTSPNPNDPDFEEGAHGANPTTYEAIRISSKHLPGFRGPVEGVYVEYQDARQETEYYDIRKDPFELNNIASKLTGAQRAELHKVLARMESCHTVTACWTAGLPQ
jgi:N-acetylglucosamine-6-sulfatase